MKKIPFTLIDIAILFFLYVFLTTFCINLLFYFTSVDLPVTFTSTASYTIQTLILLVLVYILNHQYGFSRYSELGFKPFSILRAVGYAILGYLAYLVIMGTLLYTTVKYDYYLPGIGVQENHMQIFGENVLGIIILGVVAIGVAPFIEELLFRGYILTTLQKYASDFTALFVSSVLFASIHFEFQVFIPLFTLGMILGHLRIKHNNIYYAIVFHMLNNSIAFIVELFFLH